MVFKHILHKEAGLEIHLNDVGFVFAAPTFEGTLLEICNGYQSATLTDMDPISITLVKQPLL